MASPKPPQGSRQPRVKMHAKAEAQPLQAATGSKCLVFHIKLCHTTNTTSLVLWYSYAHKYFRRIPP